MAVVVMSFTIWETAEHGPRNYVRLTYMNMKIEDSTTAFNIHDYVSNYDNPGNSYDSQLVGQLVGR